MVADIFTRISNEDLHSGLKNLVLQERKLSIEIIRNLREVDRRRLWAQMAYPSLFAYCMKELGYSETQSYRRISALRMIREIPEVEEKIIAGELTLSTVSQAQTFFKRESKVRKISIREKKNILAAISGKSQKEVSLEFAKISPGQIPPDSLRPISDTHTNVNFAATNEFMAVLSRALELTAHSNPERSLNHVLTTALKTLIEQIDPLREKGRQRTSHDAKNDPARTAQRRSPASFAVREHIHVSKRRAVWKRDQSCCTYTDPLSKVRCKSQYGLEIDHIVPIALGGTNEISNLRLLCRAHNQLLALQKLGRERLRPYLKSLD